MGDLLKYGLLAVGGYLLYEYFYGTPATTTPVSTTTLPNTSVQSLQPGGVASNSGSIVPPTSAPATSLVSTTFQSQLQALATAYAQANGGAGLNVDQWNYYMAQLTGVQVTGQQGEQLIQALGLTDATRGTIIPMTTYLTALSAIGLPGVGLGMVRTLQGLGQLVTY